MVYLYVADVSNLPDTLQCAELIGRLPKERQEKVKKCQKEEKRKQSLGAGLLLEKVFAKHGFCTDAIKIGEHGKPEVEGFYFNLSHSDSMVVCAVSEKPVGCDVEKLRKAPQKVAEHFFLEKEIGYLQNFGGEMYDREFFRLWTMKESYMKMTGEGMSLSLDSYEIVLDSEIHILRGGILQICNVKEYELPGYQVTVCTEDVKFAKLIQMNI